MSQAKEQNVSSGGGVILLSNNRNSYVLYDWLVAQNVFITLHSEKLYIEQIINRKPDLIISYNYGKLIRKEIIELMHGNIINLHISLLPWNRGSDPNIWSFIDGTPKGVTIHLVDEGLDTGDILFQKELVFDEERETYESSYEKLNESVVALFKEHWIEILNHNYAPRKQIGNGTYHVRKEFDDLRKNAVFSYDMHIGEFLDGLPGHQ